MPGELKVHSISLAGQDLFTIELLDERPVGFSARVPELAIYTFGATEKQALDRAFTHVLEKYEDLLLNSPIPLNENEQEFLRLYRTKIIPALVEQNLWQAPRLGFWQRLRRLLNGGDLWRIAFLESLKTSLEPSGV